MNINEFMFAGNATFTIKNKDTGNRFTFKVRMREFDGKTMWFVSVMNGPDNEKSYAFLGTIFIDKTFKLSNKSIFKQDAVEYKVFTWFYKHREALPSQIEVYHEGKCGRCGRKLTVPESIISGFGPECSKRM